MKNLLPVYKKVPIVVAKAKGKYIWSEKGEKYLDFLSGISVTNLGHCDRKTVAAIKRQADRYLHVSNLYHDRNQEKYARWIIRNTFPGFVFFSNSGAEANELAIKLARRYGADGGRYRIITFKNSFHGRTISTISATGQGKFRKGFSPLLSGFDYAVFNDISSVKKKAGKRTVAVIIEPVQGEGGVYVAEREFLKKLSDFCRRKKILLVFDEIQTGFGRCGEMFAFKSYGVKPDVLTLAKSAGGGLPLGITVIRKGLEKFLPPGSHGSTFGGNPLSVAAGLAAATQIDGNLLGRVRKLGGLFTSELGKLREKYAAVKEVRGMGLMVAVEFSKPIAGDAFAYLLKRKILSNACKDSIVRFLPPFTVSESDIRKVVGVLEDFLRRSDR